MIVYLAKHYTINTLAFFIGLGIIPLGFGLEPSYVIPRAIFWSGIFSAVYTWYSLRNKKIWPLYDNLRYPKYLLLTGFFVLLQTLNFIIQTLY